MNETRWYQCPRCDAGYDSGPLEQECICHLCIHGVLKTADCYFCTLEAMSPENHVLKDAEIKAIKFFQENEE